MDITSCYTTLTRKLFAGACQGISSRVSGPGRRGVDQFGKILVFLMVCLIGCSVLDRQGDPQILDLKTDREPEVGRRQKVRITLVSDDPDNDELDFRWIATGGQFEKSGQDTLIDLFQDSVSVVWVAPSEVGSYDLTVEVGDGRSGTVATSALRILVTQAAPTADAGMSRLVAYNDTLEIVLDGTGSFDPDEDLLRFRWDQISGPRVALQPSEGEAPTFRASAPGDYVFLLSVRDDVADTTGALTSDTDVVTIRVTDRGGRGG